MTELIPHILTRAFVHIVSAAFVYLLIYFLTSFLERRLQHWKLILPAVIALGYIGWNEVYDLSQGQSVVKAVTDAGSWIVGLGLAVWGLYRFKNH